MRLGCLKKRSSIDASYYRCVLDDAAYAGALAGALAAESSKDWARSHVLCEKALLIAPEDPDALNLLGRLSGVAGDTVRAISLQSFVLHLSPGHTRAASDLERARRTIVSASQAQQRFEEALQLEPDVACHRRHFLSLAPFVGMERVEELLRECISLDPSHAKRTPLSVTSEFAVTNASSRSRRTASPRCSAGRLRSAPRARGLARLRARGDAGGTSSRRGARAAATLSSMRRFHGRHAASLSPSRSRRGDRERTARLPGEPIPNGVASLLPRRRRPGGDGHSRARRALQRYRGARGIRRRHRTRNAVRRYRDGAGHQPPSSRRKNASQPARSVARRHRRLRRPANDTARARTARRTPRERRGRAVPTADSSRR